MNRLRHLSRSWRLYKYCTINGSYLVRVLFLCLSWFLLTFLFDIKCPCRASLNSFFCTKRTAVFLFLSVFVCAGDLRWVKGSMISLFTISIINNLFVWALFHRMRIVNQIFLLENHIFISLLRTNNNKITSFNPIMWDLLYEF